MRSLCGEISFFQEDVCQGRLDADWVSVCQEDFCSVRALDDCFLLSFRDSQEVRNGFFGVCSGSKKHGDGCDFVRGFCKFSKGFCNAWAFELKEAGDCLNAAFFLHEAGGFFDYFAAFSGSASVSDEKYSAGHI